MQNMQIKNNKRPDTDLAFPNTPEEAKKILKSFKYNAKIMKITQEDISRDTGIIQESISKILSGKFKKLDGKALILCNYAYSKLKEESINNVRILNQPEIARLSVLLSAATPESVEIVINLLKIIKDLIYPKNRN